MQAAVLVTCVHEGIRTVLESGAFLKSSANRASLASARGLAELICAVLDTAPHSALETLPAISAAALALEEYLDKALKSVASAETETLSALLGQAFHSATALAARCRLGTPNVSHAPQPVHPPGWTSLSPGRLCWLQLVQARLLLQQMVLQVLSGKVQADCVAAVGQLVSDTVAAVDIEIGRIAAPPTLWDGCTATVEDASLPVALWQTLTESACCWCDPKTCSAFPQLKMRPRPCPC